MTWRASTYCDSGQCVEVGSWRKSSRSGYTGNCVEVGHGAAVVGVRDSALPGSPVLEFPAQAWERFTAALKTAPG